MGFESVNVLSGGNPDAKPEKVNTVTAGVVFTDFNWVPPLLISVDYWKRLETQQTQTRHYNAHFA